MKSSDGKLKVKILNFFPRVSQCYETQCSGNNEWYWQLTGTNTQPLAQPHIDAVFQKMNVDSGSNKCITVGKWKNGAMYWKSLWCDDNNVKIICEFDGQGLSPTGNKKQDYKGCHGFG